MNPIALVILTIALATTTAFHARQPDDNKEPKANVTSATLLFTTGVKDTKDTVLATNTRVRVRVQAGTTVYSYDCPTIAGETVGEIAQQVFENMKTAGWIVAERQDGTGVVVRGFESNQPNKPPVYTVVGKAGIHYSGDAQPVAPELKGNVYLLLLHKGEWKQAPKG